MRNRLLIRSLAATALAVAMMLAAMSASAAQGDAETWESDWGQLTLSYGPPVTGTWQQSASQIGLIDGGSYDPDTRTLFFTYTQDWNQVIGEAVFSVAPDGLSMTGTWDQLDNTGHNAGTWIAQRATPSLLAARP
ncbi:MAG: hypothetical protein QOF51_2646 [Chloroflexota bacterium]|jgi:hypothetical protein|nr:hypothetical protein [Chloroflexota bacterium]